MISFDEIVVAKIYLIWSVLKKSKILTRALYFLHQQKWVNLEVSNDWIYVHIQTFFCHLSE